MKKTIAKTIIQPKTSTALSLLRVACLFVQLRQVVVGCCASWLIAAAHLLKRNLRTFTAVTVDQGAAFVVLAHAVVVDLVVYHCPLKLAADARFVVAVLPTPVAEVSLAGNGALLRAAGGVGCVIAGRWWLHRVGDRAGRVVAIVKRCLALL